MSTPSVLVTGAAGAIGEEICRHFHDLNYNVIATDVRFPDQDVPYHYVPYDLLKLSDNEGSAFLETIRSLCNDQLNVIVNNAATQITKNSSDLSHEDWDATLSINLLAPFWLSQFFIDSLKRNNGAIINISSIHATLTKRKFVAYATSKGAITTMTKALALDLAPEIKVNGIILGATDTPMLKAGFSDEKSYHSLVDFQPIKRLSLPADVAKTVEFLARSDIPTLTGSLITLDGGISSCLHDPE